MKGFARMLSCSIMIGIGSARSADIQPSRELIEGMQAYNAGRFASAWQSFQAAADRGEPQAMVNLGYMLARGHGVASDPGRALQFYRRAAELGDGEAMNAVGYRYQFALKPDFENAVLWYCRAVARGNSRGMNNLALLLWYGQGVTQDQEDARNLWRQAIALGSLSALTNLGQVTLSDPQSSDAERTASWAMLHDAATKGSGGAQHILRSLGDTEAFPPEFDESLPMRLESLHPVAGSSRACGDLIS